MNERGVLEWIREVYSYDYKKCTYMNERSVLVWI